MNLEDLQRRRREVTERSTVVTSAGFEFGENEILNELELKAAAAREARSRAHSALDSERQKSGDALALAAKLQRISMEEGLGAKNQDLAADVTLSHLQGSRTKNKASLMQKMLQSFRFDKNKLPEDILPPALTASAQKSMMKAGVSSPSSIKVPLEKSPSKFWNSVGPGLGSFWGGRTADAGGAAASSSGLPTASSKRLGASSGKSINLKGGVLMNDESDGGWLARAKNALSAAAARLTGRQEALVVEEEVVDLTLAMRKDSFEEMQEFLSRSREASVIASQHAAAATGQNSKRQTIKPLTMLKPSANSASKQRNKVLSSDDEFQLQPKVADATQSSVHTSTSILFQRDSGNSPFLAEPATTFPGATTLSQRSTSSSSPQPGRLLNNGIVEQYDARNYEQGMKSMNKKGVGQQGGQLTQPAIALTPSTTTGSGGFGWQDAVRGRKRSATVIPVLQQQQQGVLDKEDGLGLDGQAALISMDNNVEDRTGSNPKRLPSCTAAAAAAGGSNPKRLPSCTAAAGEPPSLGTESKKLQGRAPTYGWMPA
ncbi:hypothetical protein CEUSTIGMA_g6795.t1 [Chlamydomonas eustigma]|uniref:Uncharacterized protein n=1 Tax=Chlamydomonas eustigma TaxID=1157962 RepID=A0A250X8F4_9CHLO|nr:hypothetical protein CEUSTIGMA_g6795.t1 [Chlamydomonas eustigma]|eukprot:GAX79353.1 hypothetical protein CEUSTIGMA_g6795.t1 [Chlamydomonas eustigma]